MSASMDAELLEAALQYAGYGWSLIPVWPPNPDGTCTCPKGKDCKAPGKHPRLGKDWPSLATTDAKIIMNWWKRWPTANVGLVFGNLIDAETDNKKEERLLFDLFDGDLPVCPTYKGNRGPHRLFRPSPGLPSGDIIHYGDLALRVGTGAFSVAPPSRHFSGKRYAWLPGLGPDDVSPPELPERVAVKLFNLAGENPERNGRPKSVRKALYEQSSIPEGNRDNVLYAEACALWDEQSKLHGPDCFDSPDCRKIVYERLWAWNVAKCRPPLDEQTVIAKVDGGAAFIRQQASKEAIVTRHPATGCPVGWRLVIVHAEPIVYKLWSPFWEGFVTLHGKAFRKFGAICDAAAEQKNAWVPTTLAKAWKDTAKYTALPGELVASAEHEEPPSEGKLTDSLGETFLDYLVTRHSGVHLEEGEKPDPKTMGCVAREPSGAVYFVFNSILKDLKERVSKELDRPTLSAVLAKLGARDVPIGTGNAKRTVKYLPAEIAGRGVSSFVGPFLI